MRQEDDKEDMGIEGTAIAQERKGKGRVDEGERKKDGYGGRDQKKKEKCEGQAVEKQ